MCVARLDCAVLAECVVRELIIRRWCSIIYQKVCTLQQSLPLSVGYMVELYMALIWKRIRVGYDATRCTGLGLCSTQLQTLSPQFIILSQCNVRYRTWSYVNMFLVVGRSELSFRCCVTVSSRRCQSCLESVATQSCQFRKKAVSVFPCHVSKVSHMVVNFLFPSSRQTRLMVAVTLNILKTRVGE